MLGSLEEGSGVRILVGWLGVALQRIETLAEECQHHDLVGRELGILALEFLRDLGFDHPHQVAGHVGLQDFRVHVALDADGRRVAELLRDALDRGDDVALRLGLGVILLEFGTKRPSALVAPRRAGTRSQAGNCYLSAEIRSRPCAAPKSRRGPAGTIPVGLMERWLS